jgi:hypothetical protein
VTGHYCPSPMRHASLGLLILVLGCSTGGSKPPAPPAFTGGSGGTSEPTAGAGGTSIPGSGTGGAVATGGTTAAGGSSGGSDAAAPPPSDGAVTGGPSAGAYSKTITVDTTSTGAAVMTDVAKYPLAINLTAANFDFDQAKDDGADLRFASSDGKPLPFAIESWDKAGKTAAVWVKVDVKGNAKSEVVMSWGDPAAAAASDSKAVFDTADGFVGVWHLGEEGSATPGAYKDATANAADASGKAITSGATGPGRIGKGLSLTASMKQYLQIDAADKNKLFDIYDKMTYSIWVNPKSHTVEYQCMLSKGEGSFRIHFYGALDWGENKGKNIVEMCAEGTVSNDMCPINHNGTDVALNKWSHIVAVHDHPKLTLYINGAQEATLTINEQWKSDATKPVSIGNNSTRLERAFDGLLDEARVMSVPKDAAWVKLEFESQKEGSKLLTFGTPVKK